MNNLDFLVDSLGIDFRKDALGVFNPAFMNKVTRRFRESPRSKPIERRRDDLDPEHDLPCLETAKEHVVRRTCNTHDDIVREERNKDTYHDSKLLHRTQATAQVCRSRFRNIDWGNDASHTDAHAANDAPYDKVGNAERNTRTDGTHQEKARSSKHATHTAEGVG